MRKEACLRFWSGTYTICEYPSQKLITRTRTCNERARKRAIKRANARGYDVRVYTSKGSIVYKARK